uniref:(northern house mosquito) hypothetical protein n=1 Tax=Culex pipiens TaxID=7175 RepID=A0A8D8DTG8_CULPI
MIRLFSSSTFIRQIPVFGMKCTVLGITFTLNYSIETFEYNQNPKFLLWSEFAQNTCGTKVLFCIAIGEKSHLTQILVFVMKFRAMIFEILVKSSIEAVECENLYPK